MNATTVPHIRLVYFFGAVCGFWLEAVPKAWNLRERSRVRLTVKSLPFPFRSSRCSFSRRVARSADHHW